MGICFRVTRRKLKKFREGWGSFIPPPGRVGKQNAPIVHVRKTMLYYKWPKNGHNCFQEKENRKRLDNSNG